MERCSAGKERVWHNDQNCCKNANPLAVANLICNNQCVLGLFIFSEQVDKSVIHKIGGLRHQSSSSDIHIGVLMVVLFISEKKF